MRTLSMLVGTISLAACTPTQSVPTPTDTASTSADTGVEDTGTVVEEDPNIGEPSDDGVSPWVEAGTIQCSLQKDLTIYFVEVQGADYQGANTIATSGNEIIGHDSDGSELFRDALLVCSPDAECVASFYETTYDGLDCDDLGSQWFTVILYDDDGNASEEIKLTALLSEA